MDSPTPKKPMTRTEMIAALAESTSLTKQQVASLFDGPCHAYQEGARSRRGGYVRHLQPAENQGRPQARYSGTEGNQSFHQRGDGLQGQARQE